MLGYVNFVWDKCSFHTIKYLAIQAPAMHCGSLLQSLIKLIGYILNGQGRHRENSIETNMVSLWLPILSPVKWYLAANCVGNCTQSGFLQTP